MTPIVTIGIPTYNRPELLGRALASVAKQDYPSLEVVVADNATPGDGTARVVEAYRESMPGLRYERHDVNIGPLGNFMHLLDSARGQYFMWLADDDEISPSYISSLVGTLDSDVGASSAAGYWMLMRNEVDGTLMATSSYSQSAALVRAIKFIWHSDDAFFYALHRTETLRKATFRGYSWPNRGVLTNWAYVYLLDVVLRGRVLLATDKTALFINHDYTLKTYPRPRRSLAGIAVRACRRMNVHLLYWEKCTRLLSPAAMPLIIATSLGSLAREAGGNVVRQIDRRVGRKRRRRESPR